MKASVLFICLLIPLLPVAQDYRNICSSGTTLFVKSDSTMKAFRLDAMAIPGGSDTIFYSYPAIGLFASFQGCFDTAMGSILGRKIYKKSDGWFYFFSSSGDTIRIRSQASPGESWRFCALTGGDWIQATYSSAVTENILGISDPVKVITLQTKNQAGANISGSFNQKSIRLSQHFGLVKMIDVNFISPQEDTSAYYLAGKESPGIGLQSISWKDIYNFESGDEFHFRRDFSSYSSGGVERRIKRILERVVYGAWDSVSYRIEQCLAMDYGPPSTHYTHYDTTWVTYDFLELSADSSVYRLPNEFAPTGVFCADYRAGKGYQGRLIKSYTPYIYGRGPGDSCWSFLVGEAWTDYSFAKGLGSVLVSMQGMAYSNIDRLVYFRKGAETWGTPVSTSCTALVPVPEHAGEEPLSITITPNPVEDHALVSVGGLLADEVIGFSVTDLSGRVVYTSPPFIGSYRFNRERLDAGVYIISVITGSGTICRKIILK